MLQRADGTRVLVRLLEALPSESALLGKTVTARPAPARASSSDGASTPAADKRQGKHDLDSALPRGPDCAPSGPPSRAESEDSLDEVGGLATEEHAGAMPELQAAAMSKPGASVSAASDCPVDRQSGDRPERDTVTDCPGEDDEAKDDEAKFDEAKDDEAKVDEAKDDEAKFDEAKDDEAKDDEAKFDEAKDDEAKVDEAEDDEAKDDEAKDDEAKVDEAEDDEAEDSALDASRRTARPGPRAGIDSLPRG
ncbi:hypothetical protein FNF27_03008 [Cafeteria roenbergensis]|uniref:Uncharacterized protein n=1 Tax=Cafeteria roenbergensis TaxID=33653 RepID=A0A5A8EEB1_CAFRO|nr:hypothetical protein FNF27_03008 [Cafeteria roenbergensis]